MSIPHLARTLAVAGLAVAMGVTGERLRAESTAPAAPAPPPISFSPPLSLLSQVAPTPPPAPDEAAFPSIESLIAETTAAAPAGETFYDPEYGLRGRMPVGWKLKDSARSPAKEFLYIFEVADYPRAQAKLHYRKFPERKAVTREQMAEWLQKEALARTRQRVFGDGIKDYRARKGALRSVGEHEAMSWLADYTHQGERWIELSTEIHSLDGSVLIAINAPASNMAALFPQLETVVQSISLP